MLFADSIVALASGHLPAGVAIVRMSGPASRFVTETIAGPVPPNRVACRRRLKALDGSVLDDGLVLFFSAPNSFTGEDVAEFHVHGGKAVVSAVLETLTRFDDVRHADAGEFTRRAFLNGKVDLLETEALADLVNAETEAQRRFAVLNSGGAQSALYAGWRRRLIHAMAIIEAEIDFSDEDDVPGSVEATVWADIDEMTAEIGAHIDRFSAAEIIRDGFDVVIIGAPNSGKSSLFNVLAQRDAAIVTDEPGTTRDLLEVALDIGGVRVRITDTAGLRTGAGKVEAIGIQRAKERAGTAELVLLLEDVLDPVAIEMPPAGISVLRIGTKADLIVGDETTALRGYDRMISCKTGAGISELLDEIGRLADEAIGDVGQILPSRLRHVELLQDARNLMNRARSEVAQELRAEDLRRAADGIGRIVGLIDTEDLLDVIFSQFCIGK